MPDVEHDRIASVNRRQFLGRSAYNAAGLAAGLVGFAAGAQARSPSETVHIGVFGVRRQGRKLAKAFAACPNTNVHSLCDVDGGVLDRARRELADSSHSPRSSPKASRDFRDLLDNREIDAVVIATPDHSHAALAHLAFEAGKDVYLESPVCHSITEGAALLTQAETHRRVIQTGLFDRSLPHVQSAIDFVRSGKLGEVPLVKAWSVHRRPSEGFEEVKAPPHVDYAGWLYPLAERPFEPSRFHRGWMNHWDHGSGDLGTWGVALLDLARWGTGLELPDRVSATGRHLSAAAGEIPDTLQVTFASADTTITWEHRRWSNHAPEGRSTGVAFHGSRGALVLDRGGWKVYDAAQPAGESGRSDLGPHVEEFVASVRSRQPTRLSLHEAVLSANFCHLGNLAYRLGRELRPESVDSPLSEDVEARELDRSRMV